MSTPSETPPSPTMSVTAQLAVELARYDAAMNTVERDLDALVAPPPPRVLVVDDNLDMARFLTKVIRDNTGADVTYCTDPARAIELAAEDWAAVVVDLHLDHAEISGVTVARAVRRNRTVIMISGEVTLERLREAGEELRADRLFLKPLTARDRYDLTSVISERLKWCFREGETH